MSITQIVVGGIAVIIVVVIFLIVLKIKDIKRVLAREMVFGIIDKQARDLLTAAEKSRKTSAQARFLAESVREVFTLGGCLNRQYVSRLIRRQFESYDKSISLEIRFTRGFVCFVYPEFALVLSKTSPNGGYEIIKSFVSRADRVGVSEVIPLTRAK